MIQTAFLGDLLLSIPLLKFLKIKYPKAQIHLVCRKGVAEFFVKKNLVHQAYEVTKGDGGSYHKTLQALTVFSFDILLCPHESLRSALFARQIKAHRKIAFSKWWNGVFFNERVQRNLSLPESLRQLSLLTKEDKDLAQKISDYGHAHTAGSLGPVPEWASMTIKESSTSSPSKKMILFPGSTWATKQWTEQGFVQVGQHFQQQGWTIEIFGGPEEKELGSRIADQIPSSKNLAGAYSIQQSFEALFQSQCVVTNDNAGQHLASAAGIPCISIFGPTVLSFGYRPWQNKVKVVEENLSCRPCGPHGHRQCPLGHHNCMKQLSAAKVISAVEQLLGN